MLKNDDKIRREKRVGESGGWGPQKKKPAKTKIMSEAKPDKNLKKMEYD